MRITTVTPMKDEGPFILEWLAYHQLIGFNDFIVFSNDCTDGTDDLLERLDELGHLRHLPNPTMITGEDAHHWTVLRYVDTMKRIRRSDWVLSFDVDEFVCVNVGNGTLNELFLAVPDADVISMCQLPFGCGGMVNFSRKLQMDTFEYCNILTPIEGEKCVRGIKTLTSNRVPLEKFSNHAPKFTKSQLKDLVWVNGGGTELPFEVRSKPNLKTMNNEYVDHSLVQLNHYAVRSMKTFLAQADRGNANHAGSPAGLKYWRNHNVNPVKDTSIQRFSEQVHVKMNEFLEDKELRELHNRCIGNHQEKIKTLLGDDFYSDLFKRIRRAHRRGWPDVELQY